MTENRFRDPHYGELRAWSVTIGVLMVVLGILAIAAAVTTTYITVFVVGGVLAVRGLFELIFAFARHGRARFWGHITGGVLALAVGILILAWPTMAMGALTLVIIGYLIVLGAGRAIVAPMEHTPGWGWEMFAGVVSLMVGVLLLVGWPSTALWAIGLFVGIEVLFVGLAMVLLPRAVEPGLAGQPYLERR